MCESSSTSTVFPSPRQRAMKALTTLDMDITSLSLPEVFILAYELAWQESRLLTEDIVTEFNRREAAQDSEGTAADE